MPSGKQLQITKNEYPELEGLPEGSKFTFNGEATVDWQGEMGTITFNSFEVQTENKADRSLRELKGEPSVYAGSQEEDEEI